MAINDSQRQKLNRFGNQPHLPGRINLGDEIKEIIDDLEANLKDDTSRDVKDKFHLKTIQRLKKENQSLHEIIKSLRADNDYYHQYYKRKTKEGDIQKNAFDDCVKLLAAVVSGDAEINLGSDLTVTAADLNAAATGTLKDKFIIQIQTSEGKTHYLCESSLDLTPGYTPAATGTGGAPTVDATCTPSKGKCSLEVTFDTDAGATKVYEAGDTITVQVSFPGDSWLGNTVASVTKTWTVT